MALQLFAHPFSSYSQKVLIALYENGTPFEYRELSPEHPDTIQEWLAMWPVKRFPVLVDDGRMVAEASTIIEYLGLYHPGSVRLLPDDPREALEVRAMDRFFDNYIATPQQKVVFDAIRPQGTQDVHGVKEARDMLDAAYGWLDRTMAKREWATGDRFTLADCGAAPFLFYADWTHRIDPAFANVLAYRKRLLARPSVVRAVDEGRPYRPLFPLGAPDRD